MTQEESGRLTKTFGNDVDKYYVYMLIVEGEGKPFYIGKGAGTRVFAHEQDAEELIKLISEERDDTDANYNKLSEKIQTIINNKIKKVIVKWGLTSDEAFMCESALINFYDYLCFNPSKTVLSEKDVLTNIVNGHASEKEKSSMSIDELKTKARSVEDFLKNVAIPETTFPRIDKRCIFININEAMDWWYRKYSRENIDRNEYIKDSVRCFWELRNFGENNCPEYVIALYRQVVVGVYKVTSWFRFTEKGKYIFPLYSPYHRMNDECVFKSSSYENYQELFKQEFNKKYKIDYDEYLGKKKDKLTCIIDTSDMFIERQYNNLRNRIGFTLTDSDDTTLKKLVGKLLKDPFLRTRGGLYNFDSKGNINYDKWNSIFDDSKIEYLLDASNKVYDLLKQKQEREGDNFVITSQELEEMEVDSNGNCIRCYLNYDLSKGGGMCTPPYELQANCAFLVSKRNTESTIRHEIIHCLDYFKYDYRSAKKYPIDNPVNEPSYYAEKGGNIDVNFPEGLDDAIKNNIKNLVYTLDLYERYAIFADILYNNGSYDKSQCYKNISISINKLKDSYSNSNKSSNVNEDFALALMHTIALNCTNENTYFLPQFLPEKYRDHPEHIKDMSDKQYKKILKDIYDYFTKTWQKIEEICKAKSRENKSAITTTVE